MADGAYQCRSRRIRERMLPNGVEQNVAKRLVRDFDWRTIGGERHYEVCRASILIRNNVVEQTDK